MRSQLTYFGVVRCCQPQGPDEAAARLVDGILRRKSFYFQQRSGKLNMRTIGRVDIDSVVKDVDIDTLQVRHVTFTRKYLYISGTCGLTRSHVFFTKKMAGSIVSQCSWIWLRSERFEAVLSVLP